MATTDRKPELFRTTRWSVIQAARGEDSAAASEALATLCETYWYPLYAYVRRSGSAAEDARDLTQAFFVRLIEKRDIDTAQPQQGKFRAYLLACMRHFLANERARVAALKRGGGRAVVSFDSLEADRRYDLEPDPMTPERIFLRNWALTLVSNAIERLRQEYDDQPRGSLFARLRPILLGDPPALSRRELAAELSMSEGALGVAIHRLRYRFRAKLREEIAQTVSTPAEIDGELRELYAALDS